ncbi:probable thiopurine S-methyltransferase [Liolophura sinensis]|uniref:probable thiopurine S-methyltransferase n=1 Tax=Liolophura sinensis TaxID=3198878 RepID=UPI003158ECE2
MEVTADGWRKMWKESDMPCHYRNHVHKLLQSNFCGQVEGRRDLYIFVPLCGKTLDMRWLAEQGNHVVGVDMVETPVRTFFETEKLDFVVENSDTGPLYKTADGRIKVHVCDLFRLSKETLGVFDVIWDRAAFVALNRTDRQRYVSLLKSLMAEGCRYLLSAVDMKKAGGEPHKGPPQVTRAEDIQALFGNEYTVSFVEGLDCTPDADPVWDVEWFYENLYLIQMRKSA